jgi:Spy/CpxP family protein refolding chaperone
MRIFLAFLLFLVFMASDVLAAPPPMECVPGLHVEEGLGLACTADLSALGLAPKQLEDLENKRFAMRAKVIRGQADLRVLKLELERLCTKRGFDPAAGKKKLSEISNKIEALKLAHLNLLSELSSSLTDEQWAKLRSQARGEGQPGCAPGKGGGPCGTCREAGQPPPCAKGPWAAPSQTGGEKSDSK